MQQLKDLFFEKFNDELAERTPFPQFFVAAKGDHNVVYSSKPLCMATSTLLRHRNNRMSAIQYVIGIRLWKSGM